MMNQLINSGLKPSAPVYGDFYLDGITIAVGGKQKSKKQIKALENAYIAADDILTGYDKKIPLWMFGLMY